MMTLFRERIVRPAWVHGLLCIWLLAWPLMLLAPCCEAIAVEQPHSQVQVLLIDGELGHHDAYVATDMALQHDYCQQLDARDLNQPIVLAMATLQDPQPAALPPHASSPALKRVPLLLGAMRYDAVRTSPLPLYLRTLRLRI